MTLHQTYIDRQYYSLDTPGEAHIEVVPEIDIPLVTVKIKIDDNIGIFQIDLFRAYRLDEFLTGLMGETLRLTLSIPNWSIEFRASRNHTICMTVNFDDTAISLILSQEQVNIISDSINTVLRRLINRI